MMGIPCEIEKSEVISILENMTQRMWEELRKKVTIFQLIKGMLLLFLRFLCLKNIREKRHS